VGRVVDDETGAPLWRERTWVHGFIDATGAQVTAKPASDSNFELVLPGRDVRLRVARNDGAYVSPWEKRFVAKGDLLDVEVRLVPTHHLVVRGRILRREGGVDRPLREGELPGKVGISLHPAAQAGSEGYAAGLEVDRVGEFVVRVPRAKYRVMTLNLAGGIEPREVDLSGIQGPEHRTDFVLVPR
jgi:hypothetical protein